MIPPWARRALGSDLLLGAGLVALMFLVSASAPRWSRFLRQPLPSSADEAGEGGAPEPATPEPSAPAVERTIEVKLFFVAADGGGLVLEERALPFAPDLARQLEILVGELIAGPREGLVAPLSAETRVLGAFVTPAGVAYVNLSSEARAGLPGGSRAELLSVYALVDSISANFPAVRRVQLLIDDQPAETLAGHVDLSRPLPPDMSLLAAATLTPVGSAASPAPGPSPEAARDEGAP